MSGSCSEGKGHEDQEKSGPKTLSGVGVLTLTSSGYVTSLGDCTSLES